MGRGRGRASSCSSSTIESCNQQQVSSLSTKSSLLNTDLSTDLELGLSIHSSSSTSNIPIRIHRSSFTDHDLNNGEEGESESNVIGTSLYAKVYVEGIPIGRKLDLLSLHGYHDLLTTLDLMFNTNILWGVEMDYLAVNSNSYQNMCHVLTYEDKDGDWMMVGDVPWETFLSKVRRSKITRA